MSASEDSDDNQSVITVCPNNSEDRLVLNPTDPADYINANVFGKHIEGIIDGMPASNLQTIVEVVNPMLAGDGMATEIAVGYTNDESLSSFDVDTDNHDGVIYRHSELSLNDKMKNVLKELKQNEKVRLSLSRSMDDEEEDDDEYKDVDRNMEETKSTSFEEKTGSIGTVFMVRERLINDFYDHETTITVTENVTAFTDDTKMSTNHNFYKENIEFVDNCQVYTNPNVEQFLANEIRHAEEQTSDQHEQLNTEEMLKARKETLTLDLNQPADEVENDDDGDDEDVSTTDNTPTTPTKSFGAAGGKKKKRKNKSKKK